MSGRLLSLLQLEEPFDFAFHNLKGQPGQDGSDGFSPVITVTEISGGHNVEITDAQGTTDFDVLDGEVTEDALEERLIDKADVITSSASGEIVTIADGGDDLPIKGMTIQLLPVQSGSGDPSPDNVRPISGWTGLEVHQRGFNLCPTELPSNFIHGQLGSSTITSASNAVVFAIPVPKNTSICVQRLSTDSTGGNVALGDTGTLSVGTAVYDKLGFTGAHEQSFNTGSHGYVYIQSENETKARALFTTAELMISLGSGRKTYVAPKQGEIIPIDWTDDAGTVYGGSLDLTTGVLTVDKVSVMANDDDIYISSARQRNTYGTLFDVHVNLSPKHSVPLFEASNIFALGVHSYLNIRNNQFYSVFRDGNNVDCMRICWGQPQGASSLAEFKAFLQSNPAQFVYELETPLTFQLSETQIATYLGVNNFWSNGTIDLEYRCDTKLYIEQLTKPTEDDMTANTNIASGVFFMIGNNLYLSTASIASGEAIVPGTNCTALSLADALNNLNA